jgi:hypothetical protein
MSKQAVNLLEQALRPKAPVLDSKALPKPVKPLKPMGEFFIQNWQVLEDSTMKVTYDPKTDTLSIQL